MSPKQEALREQWRKTIAQQAGSGQSVRAFCHQHDLGEHTFYSWRQRLRAEATPVGFALVTAKVAEPPSLELLLPTGDRLRIPADPATLRTVLSVLRES